MLWDVGRQSDDETPKVSTSVVDPLHFGTDPDPWIHTNDLQIRILHFSSVADKMPKKVFFAFYFLKVHFNQSSKIKCQKEVTKYW
jgi:hypothetical protein